MKTISLAAILCVLCLTLLTGEASANLFAPLKSGAVARQDIFAVLGSVSISLEDAINAAEKTVFGRPVKAELISDSNPPVYRVAIADANSRTLTLIKVDAGTGSVLSSRVVHPGKQGNRHKAEAFSSAPASKP